MTGHLSSSQLCQEHLPLELAENYLDTDIKLLRIN